MPSIGLITQKLAYEEAQTHSGTTRATVYLFIKENPGVSRRDVSNHTGLLINSVCARVKELLSNGSVYESGTTICSSTGKKVAVLSITNDSNQSKISA